MNTFEGFKILFTFIYILIRSIIISLCFQQREDRQGKKNLLEYSIQRSNPLWSLKIILHFRFLPSSPIRMCPPTNWYRASTPSRVIYPRRIVIRWRKGQGSGDPSHVFMLIRPPGNMTPMHGGRGASPPPVRPAATSGGSGWWRLTTRWLTWSRRIRIKKNQLRVSEDPAHLGLSAE